MQWASSIAISAGLRRARNSGEPRHRQTLGRDHQEIELARQPRAACFARLLPRAVGVDPLCGKAPGLQLRDLVFHQRDERADDERGPPRAIPGTW